MEIAFPRFDLVDSKGFVDECQFKVFGVIGCIVADFIAKSRIFASYQMRWVAFSIRRDLKIQFNYCIMTLMKYIYQLKIAFVSNMYHNQKVMN